MPDKLGVGMISYAHVHAQFRSRALCEIPEVSIKAIADDNEARGRAAASEYGAPYYYSDYRSLLDRKDIGLVFIHSETNRHAEIAIAAAEAGKHVFCEKPMTTSMRDARRIMDAVRRTGVRFTMGFCSRFMPEAERAKEIVDSGVLGDITMARAIIGLAGVAEIGCPPDMVEWMLDPERSGGGAFIDEGSHGIDLLRWLMGDIESISAFVSKTVRKDLPLEDTATAILRFKNGAIGELSTSWNLNIDIRMRNVIELYGSLGTMLIELTTPLPAVKVYTRESLPATLAGWVNPYIIPQEVEPHNYLSWPTHVQHYRNEVRDVIWRFLDGREFRVKGEDGYAALEAILAGYVSAREGKEIKLPLMD
ncbi:MAG: Gfo/Idh/MocA family oxidoreductase [Firmicutes bacterium]|nr:Gfo/Idh/MocA family oxidoreductase [Bacillota bacterium]